MKCKLFLIHGAFQGGFVWKTLTYKLQNFGYEVIAPTLTGNTLTSHIEQISEQVRTISTEECVTLLGHSYGSLVITGVAKRLPERINGLIYLDAPVPFHPTNEPQSLLDILGPSVADFFMSQTADGILRPFPPAAFGLDPERHSEIIAQHKEQALLCFTEKVPSWSPEEKTAFPVAYIQCAPNDFTIEQVCKAQSLGWTVHTIPCSGHCPMITHTEGLALLLHQILPQSEENNTH